MALEDTILGHGIAHMKDYTRKLEALRFTLTLEQEVSPKQDLYRIPPTQGPSQAVAQEPDLLLLENTRIVQARYGYADLDHPSTQVYVIPVHVREIRGKVMELLREPAAADPAELKHPLAIQLEQQLMAKPQGTQVDLTTIHKALDAIKKYHGGVKRKSGEPFFTHPMAVALILLDYSKDQDAIIAALLHGTVEDASLSMAHIRAMFGETVAFLVGRATNLEDNMRRLSLEGRENLH